MNQRRHRPGEFAMRPASTDPDPRPDPTDILDRVWAATCPDDPSPAVLDALWASAARELDRIEAASGASTNPELRLSLPSKRNRAIVWVALAQAAAILIAAGVLFARRGEGPVPTPEVAVRIEAKPELEPVTPRLVGPPPQLATSAATVLDVPVGQTLLKSIDQSGFTFLANPAMDRAFPDWTEHDVFNSLETLASLESRAAL